MRERFHLGLDTSSHIGSIALVGCDGSEYFCSYRTSTGHFALDEEFRNLLNLSGATLDDIKEIYVCSGPGYFTGLRLGIAFAKGLAFGKGIPVKYVSSPHALLKDFNEGKFLIGVEVAKGEFYAGLFEKSNNFLKKVFEYGRVNEKDLAEILKFLEDDVKLAGEIFSKMKLKEQLIVSSYYDALSIIEAGSNLESVSPLITQAWYV